MKKVLIELIFGYLPVAIILQLTIDFIYNCCIDLEYYFLIYSISIVLISIDTLLTSNNILSGVTSHTIKKFKIKLSLYLSLLLYLSFSVMIFLNYYGLYNFKTEFFLSALAFSLCFFAIRLLELNHEHKEKLAKAEK